MSFEWVPLNPQAVPARPDRRTEEERRWMRFRFPLLVKEHGAATHLAFHPSNYVAVACGPRVVCFDGSFPNADPIRTFSKFKGAAYGVSFRADGKLLVAGGEEGKIRVFDESSKSIMKQFHGHVGAVRVASFTPDKVHVMSGGDDKSVRKWDLGTEQQIFSKIFHSDYVRSGFVLESTPDIWVTGGYDKRVIGMDTRTEETSWTLSLENPVEQVLSFNLDGNLAVAHGNGADIYDLRSLDNGPLTRLTNHAKTVTCLATCDKGSRLLTGSVDQTVKVWNVAGSFDCVLTQRFSGPILSVGMAPSNEFFVVGMADGLISMQHRPPKKTMPQEEEEASYQRTKGHGIDHKPERGDFRVPTGPRVKRSRVDALLRKYRYKEALDASIEERESTGLTIALISDLIDRRALDAALSGRDDQSLLPLMDFVYTNITKPFYAEICIDVLDRLLELYSVVYSQSKPLQESFSRVKRKLEGEISLQKQYMELLGQVETAHAQIQRAKN